MRFFNLHTHHANSDHDVVALLNVHERFDAGEKLLSSCGLHPWYLNEESVVDEFANLKTASQSPNTLAIGECGLDKVCNTPWAVQMLWFEKQISLAQEVNKPLIIHCVRAYDEVLNMLMIHGNRQPVIFHGYHKKWELAEQLLRSGAYLSFGKHLAEERVREVFARVPLERIFLETDNADCSIQDVYTFAAQAKNIMVEEMKQAIARNVHRVFVSTILL